MRSANRTNGSWQRLPRTLGVALENARLFDETKRLLTETEQRNAELAVINEISEALAKQLDFQRIVDAVGDRVRAIFDVRTAGISLYDPVTRLLSSPYMIDLGVRLEVPVMPLNAFTERMIRDGLAIRTGTSKESAALGAEIFGTDIAQSYLGVPITAGDRVLGLISIERVPANAFDQNDERLLSTIASNMGVALENARLFGETKHLLAETDARAGELAIINEIGAALAEQLDFQAIIDLVGERVGAILGNPDVGIALYDPSTNIVSIPYSVEDGKREFSTRCLRAWRGPHVAHHPNAPATTRPRHGAGGNAWRPHCWRSGQSGKAVIPGCSNPGRRSRSGCPIGSRGARGLLHGIARTTALDAGCLNGRRTRERPTLR